MSKSVYDEPPKAKSSNPSDWKSRIVGLTYENPESLLANPKNFRIHPKAQQEALKGVLSEVGWVTGVLQNDVTGHLIDGHDRIGNAISTNQSKVPVIHVELSQEEEDLILATFDPISAMAGTDQAQLDELLLDVHTTSEAVDRLLRDLASKPALDPKELIGRNEEYKERFELVIECSSESELEKLFEEMSASGRKCRTLML